MSNFEFPHTRTYDSDLGWLIKQVKTNSEAIEVLEKWVNENNPTIEELVKFMKDLQNEYTLPDGVKQAIYDWCRHHIEDLVGELVKNVFFGITDDGYFVAFIPESWDDIRFGTSGLDDFPPGVDYGHLTLSY